MNPIDPSPYPQLARFYEAQIEVFPEHAGTLNRRFKNVSAQELASLEILAESIARIVGPNLTEHCEDYRFVATEVLKEEIFFRRENRYRLTSFAEAEATVYADKVYMTRYMNGLLMSQIWWGNHTKVMEFYQTAFLDRHRPGFHHLEIGPGHGLFLHFAAMHPRCGAAAGWDVSEASLALARSTLSALGCTREVDLTLVNMFDAPKGQFDSIVCSEVLEHLEEPGRAVEIIGSLLAPGGRTFINAPVNSPAPDHITLFRTPEELVALVEASGLIVEDTLLAPTAGASLARARKLALAVSTVVTARRAG